ncbi:hypothetical protein M3A49_01020 [Paraburkholderia sp. CNPSo 3076]|uniref:hypothetical protein n=1 Tax=Paraburkholderia sp. CNPSo 3076 TaxID=2940936 RepID=UPI00224D0734|nr:hypothetical protein [Paraburkholderia sp. CNPSo 3076]MCX5538093.1 hypothetical protein [Paraburkholderia sp. CNPSo 3076]
MPATPLVADFQSQVRDIRAVFDRLEAAAAALHQVVPAPPATAAQHPLAAPVDGLTNKVRELGAIVGELEAPVPAGVGAPRDPVTRFRNKVTAITTDIGDLAANATQPPGAPQVFQDKVGDLQAVVPQLAAADDALEKLLRVEEFKQRLRDIKAPVEQLELAANLALGQAIPPALDFTRFNVYPPLHGKFWSRAPDAWWRQGQFWFWSGGLASLFLLAITVWVALSAPPCDRPDSVIVAAILWGVVPPIFWWWHWFFFFPPHRNADSLETFKYGAQLALAIWAAVVVGLAAYSTSDYFKPPPLDDNGEPRACPYPVAPVPAVRVPLPRLLFPFRLAVPDFAVPVPASVAAQVSAPVQASAPAPASGSAPTSETANKK